MGDLSENFSAVEFACPCCGQSKMDHDFIHRFLQPLRSEYGKPISIVFGGGYRCGVYDRSDGAHPLGMAADPDVPREDFPWLIEAAWYYGMTGLGVKNKGGRFQMHWDTAPPGPGRPRPWVWTY